MEECGGRWFNECPVKGRVSGCRKWVEVMEEVGRKGFRGWAAVT